MIYPILYDFVENFNNTNGVSRSRSTLVNYNNIIYPRHGIVYYIFIIFENETLRKLAIKYEKKKNRITSDRVRHENNNK